MTLEASQLIANAVSSGQSSPDVIITGAQGREGRKGRPAHKSHNGMDGPRAWCNAGGCTRAGDGAPGQPAIHAGRGEDGGDGGDAPPANISIGVLQGLVFIFGSGGNGGDGGNGSDGGESGNGGNGGSGDSWGLYKTPGGNGGDSLGGGQGGNGGDAGDGGNGSLVTIQCGELSPDSELVPSTASSNPGIGGQGGFGGLPGMPGRAGHRGRHPGRSGSAGPPGSPGKEGKAGGPSMFDIKQMSPGTFPKSQKSITVAPGQIYRVTGRDRTFDTVTIQEGGILSIETSQAVTIATLVKVAAPPKSKARTTSTRSERKVRVSSGNPRSKSKA
ncbi:MAG TPA: hypothetical protein VN956_03520 [Pyrinomonadaceae bacterium]|nr:hypothetical protein [Pyrinomonadaceae bacterium]